MLKGVALVKFPSGLEEAMPCAQCVRVDSERTEHAEPVVPPAAAKEAKG